MTPDIFRVSPIEMANTVGSLKARFESGSGLGPSLQAAVPPPPPPASAKPVLQHLDTQPTQAQTPLPPPPEIVVNLDEDDGWQAEAAAVLVAASLGSEAASFLEQEMKLSRSASTVSYTPSRGRLASVSVVNSVSTKEASAPSGGSAAAAAANAAAVAKMTPHEVCSWVFGFHSKKKNNK